MRGAVHAQYTAVFAAADCCGVKEWQDDCPTFLRRSLGTTLACMEAPVRRQQASEWEFGISEDGVRGAHPAVYYVRFE